MEHINEAVTWVNYLSNFFNAFSSMFNSLGSALIAASTAFFTFAGICSAAASRMPKPNDNAPLSYILIYRFINRVAFNYGNAENKEK